MTDQTYEGSPTAKTGTEATVTPVGQPEQKKKEPKHRNNVWFCQKVELQQTSIPGFQSLPDKVKQSGIVTVLIPVVGPAVTTQAVKKMAKGELGAEMREKLYKVAALSDDIEPTVEEQTKIDI